MPRLRLLAAPLAGLALFGVAGAADAPQAAITHAALAPYRDELLRNPSGLCGDLTPAAAAALAAELAPGSEPGASCEQDVRRTFAATAPPALSRAAVLGLRARASRLRVDGRSATGIFSLIATEAATRRGSPAVRILSLGSYRLSLGELDGRWLVSSPAHLAEIADCRLHAPGHCRPGVEDLLFTLGEPVGTVPGEAIPTPPAVRRAGRREQREFAAGRTVLAQTGCLACHRIGQDGNRGPGQNLTHVGTRLTPRQIERALLHPRAPMPSFRGLPARKLRDLVRFLSLLR